MVRSDGQLSGINYENFFFLIVRRVILPVTNMRETSPSLSGIICNGHWNSNCQNGHMRICLAPWGILQIAVSR
jgi:hypothetical protein